MSKGKPGTFFSKMTGTMKSLYKEVTTYWSKPNKEKGEYISYKEFTSFCLGATFSNSIATLTGYITFAASCLLVGAIYEISFLHIAFIGFIGLPLSYIINPINMLVQDNLGNLSKKLKIVIHVVCISFIVIGTILLFVPQALFEDIMPALPQLIGVTLVANAVLIYFRIIMWKLLNKRFGKFRPFVIAFALPCIISLALMVYLPFKQMDYWLRLTVIYTVFFFYNNFIGFAGQIGNIQNVMSPNTEERGKLMSIGCFVYSSVPSLVAILLPVFATMLGGFTDIRTYRILFPILFLIFGAGVVFFFGFSVKEKVFLSAKHKTNVTLKGFKEVLKNKYYWLTNISGLGGAITAGSVAFTNILIIYSLRADWLIGIYAGIIGTASIPGLLLAPILMRKFGKKNLMIFSKFIAMAASGLTLLAIMLDSFVLMLLFNYISILMCSPAGVASNAINADMWDYQQWKSGERLEGCTGIFGLITQPFYIVGAMIIPIIYAMMGFTTDWDVLYITELRNNILYATTLVGIVSGVIQVVPWFFYNLTDKKMKVYMDEIRAREGFTDDETDGEAGELALEVAGGVAGTEFVDFQPVDEDFLGSGDGTYTYDTDEKTDL